MHTRMEPTPEETLKLIELDFLEFIDGETQLALGATFDKSLRERLRVVLQRSCADSIEREEQMAELKDELKQAEIELKEQEEQISKLENDLEEQEGRIIELNKAIAALSAKKLPA